MSLLLLCVSSNLFIDYEWPLISKVFQHLIRPDESLNWQLVVFFSDNLLTLFVVCRPFSQPPHLYERSKWTSSQKITTLQKNAQPKTSWLEHQKLALKIITWYYFYHDLAFGSFCEEAKSNKTREKMSLKLKKSL